VVNFSDLLNEFVGNPYQAYDLLKKEHSHRVHAKVPTCTYSFIASGDGRVSHVRIATIVQQYSVC
jgi:hypothetical protein